MAVTMAAVKIKARVSVGLGKYKNVGLGRYRSVGLGKYKCVGLGKYFFL